MSKVEKPELSTASSLVLRKIQTEIYENELASGSSLSVDSYDYTLVHHGPDFDDVHWESDQISVKNDKSIRELIKYFEDIEAIEVTALVDLPFYKNKVRRADDYKYVSSTTFIVKKPEEIMNFKNSEEFVPREVLRISDNFSVHSGNLIYYKDQLIELQPQVSKICVMIMKRSKHGSFTPSSDIVDACFREEYLERAGESGDDGLVYRNLRRAISSARASFRSATGASKGKDYFPNRSGVGYTFKE